MGLAKALRADGLTASGDGFIQELSKVSEKDAEQKAHKLLQKHNLSLPIQVQKISGDSAIAGFPRLKPLDIFQFMADSGHVNKLLGGRTVQSSHQLLLEFWTNYKAIHPDFELFSSHYSEIPLEDCIPIVAHIDGGRGYKKSEFMIFDWGAVLGSGSGKKNKKDPAVRAFKGSGNKMQLPLLGHSFTTHYLYAAMPSSWHKNDEKAFQALLCTFAEDLKECFDEGISFHGRVLRLVLLGLKGDLKMQARAGRLTRWFTTARKAPSSSASKVTGQCCWLCSAGDVSAPFEEINTDSPAWRLQMPTFLEPPWVPGLEGGMLRPSLSYLDRPAKFYLADLFHIYLAGVGQDFCSSCLVYMLPTCFPGSRGNSVDAQIEKLNEVFKEWKLKFKEGVHLTAFTRDKLQFFDATSAFPAGTWSKAADTARIMKFIVYVCQLQKDNVSARGDKILHYIDRAASAISRFMKGLYEADLWIDFELHVASCFARLEAKPDGAAYNLRNLLRLLSCAILLFFIERLKLIQTRFSQTQEPATAASIARDGLLFLQCFHKLASLALRLRRPLWPFRPKIHSLHHLVLEMLEASRDQKDSLNALAFSCSQSEDFIGRTALLSRRVCATTSQSRVLQRWMAGAAIQWMRS